MSTTVVPQVLGPKGLMGIPVEMGGGTYVLPPLNAKLAKAYWPRLEALQAGAEADPLGLVAEVVQLCLARNHDGLPPDLALEHVDLDNFDRLASAAMGQKSFLAWCEQQGKAPAPQAMAAAGIGAPSTPASPPPPAGAGATSMS